MVGALDEGRVWKLAGTGCMSCRLTELQPGTDWEVLGSASGLKGDATGGAYQCNDG